MPPPPPPPPIPGWPPLSKLELVLSSDAAAPTGCPGPIGFGCPDGTILPRGQREDRPPPRAPTAPRSRLHSPRHRFTPARPRDPPELSRNERASPPSSPPARARPPRAPELESGDPELTPRRIAAPPALA
uniref:Uncharacterized protein n=1 Tax=Arundo donax TaxID=35708 RepID=A0A0A9E5K0_ARUDO